MSDDDDVLSWLENSEGDDRAARTGTAGGGAGAAGAGGGADDVQDALDWLQEEEDDDVEALGGKTQVGAAPALIETDEDGLAWLGDEDEEPDEDPGATRKVPKAKVADDAGLDWLGSGEEAPALTGEDEDEDDPQDQGSIFSMALDDFFEGMEEAPQLEEAVAAEEGDQTLVTQHRPRRKRRSSDEQRIDKVLNTLVRYLTRREPVRETQLDTIFRLTVGKIVDPISAEVIIVYFLDKDEHAHFAHLFYSRSLFRNHPGLEERFNQSLEKLGKTKIDKGAGIVGRAVEGRKSITSLDAHNDQDFLDHLGKATGYHVRTMLTVPIQDEDQVYGAVQVMNKDPNSGEEFFSFQDLKLMEEIAAYMGRLIHLVRDPDLERSDDEIARYYARMAKTEVFDCGREDLEWDARLWEVVGPEHVDKYQILPLKKLDSKTLQVVMVNPLDMTRRSSFEAATEMQIGEAFVSTEAQIKEVIDRVLKKDGKAAVDAAEFGTLTAEFGGDQAEKVELDDSEEESGPIIKLVNRIIEDAYARGASDIHIEPYETFARVRYRVDGGLSERMRLPLKAMPNVCARIKIMSNLDIAERRLPQDGKIKFKKYSRKGVDIDLRVATGPMTFGEKVVMRILAKGSISLGLDAMGFADENLKKYRWGCKQPYGMILNVGPTGSGKTTTLYSGLSEVNDIAVNIQTAEDPVEYPLDGINQMQMLKDIGLDFARALRCYMRMDPDIILVGEIRDLETAEIAIEASLTGHLLFSTLHTNDAAGTITRFTEMGIEPFMISSSLLVCCAQRLLRRLCDKCRIPWEPSAKELEILMRDPRPVPTDAPLYQHVDSRKAKKPCEKCGGMGYKGRVGTHEVMGLDDELRALINQKASANILKNCAVKNGMKTIFQDALFKAKHGISDLPDVMSKVKADEVEGQKQDEVLTLD